MTTIQTALHFERCPKCGTTLLVVNNGEQRVEPDRERGAAAWRDHECEEDD